MEMSSLLPTHHSPQLLFLGCQRPLRVPASSTREGSLPSRITLATTRPAGICVHQQPLDLGRLRSDVAPR